MEPQPSQSESSISPTWPQWTNQKSGKKISITRGVTSHDVTERDRKWLEWAPPALLSRSQSENHTRKWWFKIIYSRSLVTLEDVWVTWCLLASLIIQKMEQNPERHIVCSLLCLQQAVNNMSSIHPTWPEHHAIRHATKNERPVTRKTQPLSGSPQNSLGKSSDFPPKPEVAIFSPSHPVEPSPHSEITRNPLKFAREVLRFPAKTGSGRF